MDDLRRRRVLALGAPPSRAVAHTSLLVPAVLHRVKLISGGENSDVLLSAVRELLRANVDSPRRQAELLQLPEELTAFLIPQAKLGPASGSERRTSVRFVVQNALTTRVWGRELERAASAEVEYGKQGWPTRIVSGTAGSPIRERVFALAVPHAEPPLPSAAHILSALQDASGSLGVYSGASLVGDPLPVLMRVFVGRDADDQPTIIDPVDLSVDADTTVRALEAAESNSALADWLAPPAVAERAPVSLDALLERTQLELTALRGRGGDDPVALSGATHETRTLVDACTRLVLAAFPLERPPLTQWERAQRLRLALPNSPTAVTVASRLTTTAAPANRLVEAADAVLAVATPRGDDSGAGVPLEALLSLALSAEDAPRSLEAVNKDSISHDLTKLVDSLRPLEDIHVQ